MGRWLTVFKENNMETPTLSTDITDTSRDTSVLSVSTQCVLEEKKEKPGNRWNPELANKGYVWCLDCKHFDSVNCNHTDNPFHTVEKQPLAPRRCQWFIDVNKKITSNGV